MSLPRTSTRELCLFPALIVLMAGGFLAGQRAWGQILYGSIVGNVTDASDAAIPGATVTITNMQTNATRTAVTSDTGGYSFPTVATGTYVLRVSSDGFRTYTESNVSVTVNSVTRANVRMELGQVTEQVTVEASALRLQTDRAEVRAEVGERELKNLPVPLGRNYQMLIRTLPGISVPQNGHSVPSNPIRPEPSSSVSTGPAGPTTTPASTALRAPMSGCRT